MTMWRLLAVNLWILVGACGMTQPPADGFVGGAERQAAYDEFADCLRDHGANVGQPTLSPDGSVQLPPAEEDSLSSLGKLSQAATACQPILSARGLPAPGPIELSDEDLADLRRRSAAFAECLRTQGVDWPDPEWEGGAIVNWRPEDVGIDINDADIQRIGSECSARTGFDPMLAHAVGDAQT